MANRGQIMTIQNLNTYMKWRGSPWKVDDLLYERLPMLAVRNYLSEENDENWPLCWTKGRPIRLGLSTCIEGLKSWQAFRSAQPDSGEVTRRHLHACVPRIIETLQSWLRRQGVYRLQDAKGKTRRALVKRMAHAVAQVSACKPTAKPNPMLGSKVLHFFFPELFPVWDTAWIKKTMRRLRLMSSNSRHSKTYGQFTGAAQAYAEYLGLMFRELDATPVRAMKSLTKTAVSSSSEANRHPEFKRILNDNLWDLTPILFEVCLMGRGRARRVLP
jgi:hypothetical protein